MIIWGSRGLTSVVESNQFHCPQCGTTRTGNLKQVRNFFTLYFIPLIPLNVAGRFVECTSCAGTFAEEIMSYDPEKEKQETQMQMLRVMIMAALADGEVDTTELGAIKKGFMEFAGLPVPESTLQNEIALASSASADLNTYVGSIVNQLSPHGKALVVKLAFQTMSAAGDLRPGHQAQLGKLAETLQISQEQFMELITRISEPDSTENA